MNRTTLLAHLDDSAHAAARLGLCARAGMKRAFHGQ
ncbi:UNVERIFIED_ORG: hypothetical protein ABIC54_003422 [Burkholderia sp. 1263]|uniref:Uncharacterized protein n=1 Tax=Paraburkholderia terricola TaxID=169427 RepID=A0ABU1M1S4_9BURK|nr:hypothetical protein [Paraburkholderia terricola]MDR6449079.1 hypothetical protein [Paraburkholderia terricola]MDR6483966.1 hypothetical protein [Paraburkholderia terricola]